MIWLLFGLYNIKIETKLRKCGQVLVFDYITAVRIYDTHVIQTCMGLAKVGHNEVGILEKI